ncbi:MAG: hypothetical protein LBE62_12040 [Azonexus sp.]|jgi:hypothetical protein|nr:hypothetical protein [Azonexus sp.]
MNTRFKTGQRVAYIIERNFSAGYGDTRKVQVRRQGIVKGWRDGAVIVLHKAGYTEQIAEHLLQAIV